MKFFEVILTQKKKIGEPAKAKIRPVIVVAHNVKDAKAKVSSYWDKKEYKATVPNMVFDASPK